MSTLFNNFFNKINQISPLEHDFTEVLEAIALKPKTLYFRGKLPENMSKNGKKLRPKTVAIVGSRHNTRYGEEIAYNLAKKLGEKGVVVVSGLAFGIDSIAHRGCLAGGGKTVAVLGTRIDDIYPKTHLPLAREIIEKNGAILSEYAPVSSLDAPLAPSEAGWDGHNWASFESEQRQGKLAQSTPYLKRHIDQKTSFLCRNRLISGLADIVVVVEAAERSGSLNTATHALDQGKEVFAVPGNITSPYSQGCNKLIRQGAHPYIEPDDILHLLFPEESIKKRKDLKGQHLIGDNDVETKILQALASGLRSNEEIMKSTSLPPEVFNQSVTLLEIKSRIRALGLGNWSLS